MREPLPRDAAPAARCERYAEVQAGIEALLADEDDWIAALATVSCELHHAFARFDWTGFYRATGEERLRAQQEKSPGQIQTHQPQRPRPARRAAPRPCCARRCRT